MVAASIAKTDQKKKQKDRYSTNLFVKNKMMQRNRSKYKI